MTALVTIRNQFGQDSRFRTETDTTCNLGTMSEIDLSTKHGRLKKARIDAGFKSIRAPARQFGWTESTYKGHELGIREFGEDDARKYGRRFKKNWVWLLTGEGQPDGAGPVVASFDPDAPDRETAEPELLPPQGMVAIKEVNVFAGAGAGGIQPYEFHRDGSVVPSDAASATVLFPEAWLRDLGLNPLYTDLIRIRGASMAGVVDDGSWVFVDRRATVPSPPDIYLLWDGLGVICKYLEVVINSKPPRVRIISANDSFPPDEQPLSELTIIGRVAALIGKPQPMPRARMS